MPSINLNSYWNYLPENKIFLTLFRIDHKKVNFKLVKNSLLKWYVTLYCRTLKNIL